MPHSDGVFGLTPNTIAQTSAKVAMDSRFLGLVGSLPLDEQNLWLPNQTVHDPDTWTTPHLLQLKIEYEILVDKYGCVVQETFTVQDHPDPPSDTLLLPPLKCFYKTNERIQERPQPGDSRPVIPPSQRTLSRQIMREWEPWTTNIGSLITTEYFNSWLFINSRPSKLPGFKTSTPGLVLTMPMSPYWHMRWQLLSPVKSLPGHSLW